MSRSSLPPARAAGTRTSATASLSIHAFIAPPGEGLERRDLEQDHCQQDRKRRRRQNITLDRGAGFRSRGAEGAQVIGGAEFEADGERSVRSSLRGRRIPDKLNRCEAQDE